jgi:site-specific DNA-cytosine methylase
MARPNKPGGGRLPLPRAERTCAVCCTSFVTRIGARVKQTCSRVCAYSLRAERSSDTQSRKVDRTCEACGIVRLVSPAYRDRRFCSPSCADASMRGPNSSTYRGGNTPTQLVFYLSSVWKRTRRAVWKRDRASCRRCERFLQNESKTLAHAVHHVAGFSEWPELRLDLSNLVLLCAACHRFVHSRANREGLFIRRIDVGKALTKTAQIKMCGNSVVPQVAAAVVRANLCEEMS